MLSSPGAAYWRTRELGRPQPLRLDASAAQAGAEGVTGRLVNFGSHWKATMVDSTVSEGWW